MNNIFEYEFYFHDCLKKEKLEEIHKSELLNSYYLNGVITLAYI